MRAYLRRVSHPAQYFSARYDREMASYVPPDNLDEEAATKKKRAPKKAGVGGGGEGK